MMTLDTAAGLPSGGREPAGVYQIAAPLLWDSEGPLEAQRPEKREQPWLRTSS